MKLWKRKLKPVRDFLVDESVEVIADLDALMDQEVAFRLGGKSYSLRPLSAGEAFVVWQNLAQIESLRAQKEVSFTEVLDFYASLFKSVCPEITRKHVENMSQPQCAALLQLILDTVTGRVFSDSKKKVMMEKDQIQSTQPT